MTDFMLRHSGAFRMWLIAIAAAFSLHASATPAHAEAYLLIDANSGKVLQAENATQPWYPASLTKIMTAYVTLTAVKQGRISLDTLLTVSPNAVAQAPSKMGFPAGTTVTVDNALKMMMVKSANDMAVVLAEGVGGSIEGFAGMMNETARQLGMTQSHFVNPNGLPDDAHISSARDIGILARAFYRDLPEYEYFAHLPGIKFGRRVTMNFNKLIGRYPGADGMKTGFICASGFNLVASATRNDKHLIAVVLGAPSSAQRTIKAAQLLEKGFNHSKLAWLKPSLGTVEQLPPIDAAPPNLRDQVCGPHRKRPAAEDEDDDVEITLDNKSDSANPAFALAKLQVNIKASDILSVPAVQAQPIIVYTGPTRSGSALLAANAEEAAKQAAAGKALRKARAAKHGAHKHARQAAKPADTPVAPKQAAASTGKRTATASAAPAAKPAAKPAPASSTKPAVHAKPVAHPAKKPTANASAKPKPKPATSQKDTSPKT
ncbi:MAG: D-alanyl-D-alanine carboxypeptidase [Bradyrhizobiaceae bacterium]|nr:MAG: D-alanyl-D-alanine carboxypeptidase [Bradyrhizobiaceae bacterium]